MISPSYLTRFIQQPNRILDTQNDITNTATTTTNPPPQNEETQPQNPKTFLSLPPELREIIYTNMLLPSFPSPSKSNPSLWHILPPTPASPTTNFTTHVNDTAYNISRSPPPTTCANMLCVNRQIHAELTAVMARLRRKGVLGAGLECVVEKGRVWVSWGGACVVKTRDDGVGGSSVVMGKNVWAWMGSLLGLSGMGMNGRAVTVLERLWVDVRLCDDGNNEEQEAGGEGTEQPNHAATLSEQQERRRISWAVCAVLKDILIFGPDIRALAVEDAMGISRRVRAKRSVVLIDEVVVNVISPTTTTTCRTTTGVTTTTQPPTTGSTTTTPPSTRSSKAAKALAKDLLNVWLQLWAGGESAGQAQCCKSLLEGIERVRVCVDGVGVGTRVLRGELERGRRASGRVGMAVW
ncbi:hypothetical protein T440DRAFT_471396 [Plenodomus tracheiphilus IPT5]|uniref:F-box domain-containing protein n=1 Tax=Plenodomus tracheiphilus IPT5 TaxID=1408161 RepID=A0A6A7AXI2_9PLEO|nr:hypothetical protein T440DRAFT_471396 [Plenodomus tracheiphilus IPT5]